jgi:hypothetical protein
MKKIALITILIILVSCFGGLMYFNKEDRYSVKISMIKLKKNYDHTASWLDSTNNNPAKVLTSLRNIIRESDKLKKIEVSRNQLIYEEKLNQNIEISNLIKDAVNDNKKERATYHFKRLRNNCIACHTRFRVGVNF